MKTIDIAAPLVISPAHIMQVGMGFWASKTLPAAVKLNLFTELGENSLTATQLQDQLGLHTRSSVDFFDTLVSLNLLHRQGNGPAARYCNTLETSLFLVKSSPAYVGGLLEMANDRLYPFWGSLEEGLRTGQPRSIRSS